MSLRHVAVGLMAAACSLVLPLPALAADFTPASIAGSYAFTVDSALYSSATLSRDLAVTGVLVLGADGQISGRRLLYGYYTDEAVSNPVLGRSATEHVTDPIEQQLSGTFTVSADGIGEAQIVVDQPRVARPFMTGNGCIVTQRASESLRFVASSGGCRLEMVQVMTADNGGNCQIGPRHIRFMGLGTRQDSACACVGSAQAATPARPMPPRREAAAPPSR